MPDESTLFQSIADSISDYRNGELAQPTPDHVERWFKQFDVENSLLFLTELDHVLKRTYFSSSFVADFLGREITNANLTGGRHADFWKAANVLDIQKDGNSQSEIRTVFAAALKAKLGLDLRRCGHDSGTFIYFDDVLFSGSRAKQDLEVWIRESAPRKAGLRVVMIATHKLGEWQTTTHLEKVAKQAGKDIDIVIFASERLENRKADRNSSEVYWPAVIPNDPLVAAFVAQEERFPHECRGIVRPFKSDIFSSEEGRQVLETEFLKAGCKIREFSKNPKPVMRPLGFGHYGLGFGSTIVTYRNCPNNAPLALWWGDPSASASHPFSKWYPLVPRKTYAKKVNFDDWDF